MSGEQRRQHNTHRSLALSLARYVRPGDTKLPYDQFLRHVIDRIVDDLSTKLDPQNQKRPS